MKKLFVVSLFLVLAGCTTAPTLEELEFAALESGDWSEVKKRERAIARREARMAKQCSVGRVRVCVKRASGNQCGCVARDEFQDVFIF
ncbi:MAG: hypothetical protein QNI98_06460 [Woeseiaceae bacterium]|nr:hypothetical protein [Woeseiaceae bacterium]